jgi:hypothetical protein
MSEPPSRSDLPLFYKRPRALDHVIHAATGIRASASFAFARETNSIPLAADELFVAQAHYPVVFTASDPATAVAVVGIRNQRNLFVSRDGTWRRGSYVPAYVRRYPFMLVKPDGRDDLLLAVDETADTISSQGEEKLFDGDQPSAATRQALQFCTAFQQQYALVQQFAAALHAANVLVENRAELSTAGGGAMPLVSGFRIVDETRFNALPDDLILEWRKRGWLGLVYAHLMSMRRWEALVALAAAENDHA